MLTARNQVLNKEIDSQKQKIETHRSALANAAESFGENDRTQSRQIQLNNAQAALNGMERELNFNNTALEKADKGFDEAGDGTGFLILSQICCPFFSSECLTIEKKRV